MDTSNLWDHEEPVTDFGIDVPAWIDQDIDPATVAAIIRGGCASGAYMPAVTYYQAAETMHKHGDDVLQWLEDMGVTEIMDAEKMLEGSWSMAAVYVLSAAVDEWAQSVEEELSDALDEADEAGETCEVNPSQCADGRCGDCFA